jgi:hypothetical protein
MTARKTAGMRLHSELDAALARAGKELGRNLEWDEQETLTLVTAAKAADRAEVLREMFAAEQAGEARPTMLLQISAELRQVDRQVIDLVARINPGVGPAKSARHVKAARRRWDMKRELDGGA